MKLGKLFKRIFNPRPIDHYVSDIDTFLKTYNSTHPINPTEQAEKQKHNRIAYLRDNVVTTDIDQIIWKDF